MNASAKCQTVMVLATKTNANVLAMYKNLRTPPNWPPKEIERKTKQRMRIRGAQLLALRLLAGFIRTKPLYC